MSIKRLCEDLDVHLGITPCDFQGQRVEKSNRLDIERWVSDRGQIFKVKREDAKSRNLYHFERCPVHTDDDGGKYECCVMMCDDGTLQGHCKHDDSLKWDQFRDIIGKPEKHHWNDNDGVALKITPPTQFKDVEVEGLPVVDVVVVAPSKEGQQQQTHSRVLGEERLSHSVVG